MRLAVFVAAGCLASAAAGELRVGSGETYKTVAAALAAAAPGDTIRVSAGVYAGDLVLEKPLALIGEGRPLLRGSGHGSVITVRAPGCTIQGFRIEHCGGALVNEDSGILLHSGHNRIFDNRLGDILFGIYFYESDDNLVRGNVVRGRTELETGERGAGLHIWNSVRNTIEDNVVTGARDGMYLQYANNSLIRRNRVSEVRYGLHYMYSNDNVFEDNVFERNVAGAAIMYSARIELRRNRFVHNRGFSSFGILFQDSTDIKVHDNSISGNATGLFMEALHASTFDHNLIAVNDTAIEMFASAENNEFTENNFIGNLSPIRVIGRATTTRWSRAGRGNYWSEYDGYDLDGDGIGDVPFRIRNLYERLEGHYPRLRVFFSSPAAQALVAAERAFPILRSSDEQDAHPLMRPARLLLQAEGESGGRAHSAGGAIVAASILAMGVIVIRKGISS